MYSHAKAFAYGNTANLTPTATPTFSPVAGSYLGTQSVTISSVTPGALIFYTTDGTAPTLGSSAYIGPISVALSETVNAIAIAPGFTQSQNAGAAYVITQTAATPTFNPGAGNYSGSQSVTISCSTPSSSIFFTTDGTTPTTGSAPYTAPITVSTAETVQAIATASGFSQSAVGSAAYTFVVPTGLMTFIPGDKLLSETLYNTAPSQAIVDIGIAAAVTGALTAFNGYVAGFQWTTFETGGTSLAPTYDFSKFWQIFLYKEAVWPGVSYGAYMTGEHVGQTLTQAQMTAANMANPAGFYVPAYILNCGGSVTVPNSFGSGSSTVYPVAPIYSGASSYGLNFEGFNSGNQTFLFVIPQWYNPGVTQAFINMLQAWSLSTCPTPIAYNAGTTYSVGMQQITAGQVYTYINATPGAGHTAPNTTFWAATNQKYSGLTFNQIDIFEGWGINDENSYLFNAAQNYSSGVVVNPPQTIAGHPETVPSNTNFWINHNKMFNAAVSFAPQKMFIVNESFGFGGNFGTDSNVNMAANINGNITSGATAPAALSTIKGLAFSTSDTHGQDFNATNNAASWGGQGLVGIVSPGTGGALPTPTVASLIRFMPKVGQVQPMDYSRNTGTTNNTAAAVQAIMTASQITHEEFRHWCPNDNSGVNNGGGTTYIVPTVVSFQSTAPCTTIRPVYMMNVGVTINSVTVASATSLNINFTPFVLNAAETGLQYQVYRDGSPVGITSTSPFLDSGLTTGVSHNYTIALINSNGVGPQGAPVSGTPSGAVQQFNFANFAGAPATLNLVTAATFSGSVIDITQGVSHNGGCVWYKTLQNIQSFTTTFSYVLPAISKTSNNFGIVFVVQNTNSTTNPFASGVNMVPASANGIAYGGGGGSGQVTTANSIGLVFNTSGFNQSGWFISPSPWTTVALCVDGGPCIGGGAPFGFTNGSGYAPLIDTHPFGLNFGSGNTISCVVTYDGTTLVLVATDTTTLASTRLSWPVNIPAIVGANTAWIGFMANEASQTDTGLPTVLSSWAYSTGINTRLATPTFNVPAGQYTGTQTISLSGPVGASIYYTTNGTPPTSASTLYTSAITVSSTQAIHAVAVQAGFTDSLVAEALYSIQASATPIINYPSGFASAGGLIRTLGQSSISGSNIVLVDSANTFEAGAAWFAALRDITNFTAVFGINLSSINTSFANGLCFVLQNYPQTNTGTNLNWSLGNGPFGVTVVSGGPYTLGSPGSGTQVAAFGYVQIFASIGVVFDISTNTVGLYTNGAFPSGSQVAIGGSVSLQSVTPITATLVYNGTSLVLTLHQGANTSPPITLSASINIPSIVGASSAWAGFTGATNFGASNIQISNWTM